MHIVMVSLDYPPTVGGISAHVYELAKAIRKKGHEVSVVTKMLPGCDEFESDSVGIRVYRISIGKIGLLYGWKINRYLQRFVSERRPDLIHIHGLRPLEFFDVSAVPMVYTNHTSGYLKRIKKGGYRIPMLKRLFAKPKLFLAPSEELLEIPFPIACPKQYIPNGIDFDKFRHSDEKRIKLRKALGIDEKYRIAIVTRRLVEKNGVKYLAQAMEYVGSETLYLLLIGDGEERETIKETLEKWIPGRFSMLGSKRHEEIIAYYSAADVSILPSLMEATSISGLEAMASGLPLVGTRVGGIPDLIEEGHNGYLCEPASPKALAEAIEQLLRSDIRLMGDASREKARGFDWSVIADKTIEAYRSIR